jgi:tetratricopeptide (TPR) repeat protein
VQVQAQALTVDLRGVVSDSSVTDRPSVEVFNGRILIPAGESKEVFTGPYTVKLSVADAVTDTYAISASFVGLGPKFHSLEYNIKLAAGDKIFVPPLPVKNNAEIKYFITIVDDTSKIVSPEPPPGDSTAWGISETVHYRTHWLRGSLADYMWNLKMAYLERIYDGFRKTFTISSFYKIDYVFHPEPVAGIYMKPGLNYAVQPGRMWIDVVYGHNADGVTPRAAAELLLYKQWGYGPRWLVTGFAGFYFDNFLQLRKFSDKFTPARLDSLLSDEIWVDSDTGQIVTGALSRWLVDSDLLLKFMELYKNSGPLDFGREYSKIYGRDFRAALAEFLEKARAYEPNSGELPYFASIHMELGNYALAREYLEEIEKNGGDEASRSHATLVKCLFWQGDYDAAAKKSNPTNKTGADLCDIIKSNCEIAGAKVSIFKAYDVCILNNNPDAIFALASAYLDEGEITEAESTLAKVAEKDKARPEYFIESGRLKVFQGQRADSLLAMAAAIAMNHAQSMPHDPANYLVAGQAFLHMGHLDRAGENLETSYFLDRRPYYMGQILLELGRLYDLKGERDRALEFYNEVISINSGAYQKSLAKRYLNKKYEMKKVASSH